MFMSAVKLMESIGLGRSKHVVPPVSALADLYSAEGMDEEAIALYKQAYSIEKDASGADSPQLARHLQKLGGAYEKQGKMEAATLTLEEAGSVLEHAHGPDHPEVQALREQLAALIEPEPEEEEEDEEERSPSRAPSGPTMTRRRRRGEADRSARTGEPEAAEEKKKWKKAQEGKKKAGRRRGKGEERADAGAEEGAGKKPKKAPRSQGRRAAGRRREDAAWKPPGAKKLSRARATTTRRRCRSSRRSACARASRRGSAGSPRRARALSRLGAAAPPPPPDGGCDGRRGRPGGPMSETCSPSARDVPRADGEAQGQAEEEKEEDRGGRATRGAAATTRRRRRRRRRTRTTTRTPTIDKTMTASGQRRSAMIESQVIEIIASAHTAAQREDWAEVLDCSAQLEDRSRAPRARWPRARPRRACCSTRASSTRAGFSDEPRVRSTLGCLMLIEWCVPTCPDAFRQAVAGRPLGAQARRPLPQGLDRAGARAQRRCCSSSPTGRVVRQPAAVRGLREGDARCSTDEGFELPTRRRARTSRLGGEGRAAGRRVGGALGRRASACPACSCTSAQLAARSNAAACYLGNAAAAGRRVVEGGRPSSTSCARTCARSRRRSAKLRGGAP